MRAVTNIRTIQSRDNAKVLPDAIPLRESSRNAGFGITRKAYPCVLIVALQIILLAQGHAQLNTWKVASGTWNVAANWSQGSVPTTAQAAVIDNSGTAYFLAGLTSSGTVDVGYSHSGFLSLSANVSSITLTSSSAFIGYNPGSSGAVTVSGSNGGTSEWEAGEISVGESGTGSLTLNEGGSVYVFQQLLVGNNGTGSLNINAGSSVSAGDGSTVVIGNAVNSVGIVTVFTGDLYVGTTYVGLSGIGTLTISSGQVWTGSTMIGENVGGSGTATLSTGQWSSGNLYVGDKGRGVLNVTGGYLDASSAIVSVGNQAGSSGMVSVSGGSINTGQIYIGESGTGALFVFGGTVTTGTAVIGDSHGSSGTASVSSGSWNAGNIVVGNSGTGSLSVTGGYVGFGVADIGNGQGSTGTVSVTGGTMFSSNGAIHVGNSGTGQLSISGGVVTAGMVSLGRSANTTGTVIVSGGTLNALGALYVGGEGGAGILTVTGSGNVTVASGAGTIQVGSGTLNIGDGSSTQSGTLNVAAVNGTSGSATVNFNITGTTTFAPRLTGNLNVTKNGGGTAILIGNSTNTGTATINIGTLQIGNGSSSGSLPTAVKDNALLAFDRSDSVSYAGSISGTGNVLQIGAGTTILTGSNTYSGTTTISRGTLQIGNGGASGSPGTGAILNNGSLAFDRSGTLTLSNGISGTGSISQIGPGTAVISANSSFTGATTVSAGTLVLATSVFNSAVTIAASATLGGPGTAGYAPGQIALNTLNVTAGAANSRSIISLTLLGGTSSLFDSIILRNGLAINAAVPGNTIGLLLIDWAPLSGNSYDLLTWSGQGYSSDLFSILPESSADILQSWTLDVVQDGTTYNLELVSVPEAQTGYLVLVGISGILVLVSRQALCRAGWIVLCQRILNVKEFFRRAMN